MARCQAGSYKALHQGLPAQPCAGAERVPAVPRVAKPRDEKISFEEQLQLFPMEAVQLAGQRAEPIERAAVRPPSQRQTAFLSESTCSLDLRLPLGLDGFSVSRLCGFSFGIPASADHVTRLSRGSSPFKAFGLATAKCLRALL